MIPNRYVTLELLLHAAFVADEIWGDMLGPARIQTYSDAWVTHTYSVHIHTRY